MSSRTVFLSQKLQTSPFVFKEHNIESLEAFLSVNQDIQIQIMQQKIQQKDTLLSLLSSLDLCEFNIQYHEELACIIQYCITNYNQSPTQNWRDFIQQSLKFNSSGILSLAVHLIDKNNMKIANMAQNSAVRILSSRFDYNAVKLIFLCLELDICILDEKIIQAVLIKLAKSKYWIQGLELTQQYGISIFKYLQESIQSGNQDIFELINMNYFQLNSIELDLLREMEIM